jgi:cytoskeleton protein RodZ
MTSPDAEVTELPSSPGARLRREREARGLTEQQAAEGLNLDPSVVISLEANDFGTLGAPVFVKGHLRRYARLLELDVDEVLALYEHSKEHIDEPTLVPKARMEMVPERTRPRWPLVAGSIAAFLLAAALIAYLSEHGLPWPKKAAEEPTVELPLDVPGPSLPHATIEPAPVDETATAPGTETEAAAPTEPAAEVAATPGAETTAPGTTTPVATTEAATPPAATTPGASVPPGPGQVSLHLRFSADSWVEIFDGSGKAVAYDLGRAGTERTVTATAPLSVTLGNAPAVAITINGQPVARPPRSGTVARFSVGADGNLR